MKCNVCGDSNIGPEHEISEKHLRNQTLYEYSVNRKQFLGNRKGIIVSCVVKSSFKTNLNCVDPRILVSSKPREEITFNFNITNDCKKEDILVIFVQLAHNKLNFVMTDKHGLGFGCTPKTIKPKQALKDIIIKFKSSEIGQYEVPIIFSFRKRGTNENIIIIREVRVFIEEKQMVHEKVDSPYTQKEVKADKLYKKTMADYNENNYPIPKNYKKVYASGLKVKEDADLEEKAVIEDVCEVFKIGATRDNYVRFFHNLLWYEETIVRINLKKYNMAGVPLTPVPSLNVCYSLYVPGLGEKRPSLLIGDMIFVKPHNSEEALFEAKITSINENNIHISGLHPDFQKYYNVNAKFDIRFFLSRMPLERMHRAVDVVFRNDQALRVFPRKTTNTATKINPIHDFYNTDVATNKEQRTAVEHIVSGSCGTAPYLLHGPPGTGKTVTIVETILQLVKKDPNNRIMVCTDSNMAADHVAVMLIKYADVFEQQILLRANSKHRVWETLPECLEKYSNGTSQNNFEPISIEEFVRFNIVITTLSHAAKFAQDLQRKRMDRHITHLFIDEAGQASEPACLIPTCGLLGSRGVLVLAGDPLQLGPVVISHKARALGLGLSLMERLKNTCELYSDESNDPNYMVMLRNNFRSNPQILDIPNKIFYKGQLRALAKEDPISNVDILGERSHSQAIVFHGVLSKEQKIGKSPSFFNDMELDIVQMYLTFLINEHKVLPEDIGVVTPYIRQVYKIKSCLQTLKLGKIEVGTVEAFQGKEKRVIIISTVRANCGLLDHDAKFQLGFLVDDKRFNVALTRAKAKAIIIGNPMCLEKDVKWCAYIQKCRELGTYFGFDGSAAMNEEERKMMVDRITPLLKDLKVTNDKSRD